MTDSIEKIMERTKEKEELQVEIQRLFSNLNPNQCLKITYVDCDVPNELWNDFKKTKVIYPNNTLQLTHLNDDILLRVNKGYEEFELFLDYMLDIEVKEVSKM